MRKYGILLKHEVITSLRGVDMVIFALIMPVVVTYIIGVIYGDRLAFEGAPYRFIDQSIAALTTIGMCAGGMMGLPLVLSEYREKKILKRLKATPSSPVLLIVVQLTVYALYAFASLLLVVGTGYVFFNVRLEASFPMFLMVYILVMAALFSIGVLVGGLAKNMKIAGVLASLLYFPMLLFSGATLPFEVFPIWLQNVSKALPLTQGIVLLKRAFLEGARGLEWSPLIGLIALFFVCTIMAVKFFKWE